MKVASSQQDVIYSVILNNDRKNLTNYLDINNPYIKKLVKSTENIHITEIIKLLNKDPTVLTFEFPIRLDSAPIGTFVMGLSQNRIYTQVEKAKKEQ
jgi:hypothetical protein